MPQVKEKNKSKVQTTNPVLPAEQAVKIVDVS